MSQKIDRGAYDPSWTEVILGATLSAVLGAAIGAGLLIAKPVESVKELPKEEDRVAGAVYYVEGSRDSGRARQAGSKKSAFLSGQSVAVTEEEINALIPQGAPAGAPKAGKKGEAAADEGGMLAAGAPNVRIRDGVMQVGVPVTLNLFDLGKKIVAQGRGGFEKRGDVFVYAPDELYFGSLAVQRLPFLSGYVRDKFIASQPIPEDIATAWRKLNGVSVEGNTLKLTMP